MRLMSGARRSSSTYICCRIATFFAKFFAEGTFLTQEWRNCL
jgi:hypothetical protein